MLKVCSNGTNLMQKISDHNSKKFSTFEAQLHNLYGGKFYSAQSTKVERFRKNGLPPIISRNALSQFLGLSSDFIRNMKVTFQILS